MDKMPRGLARMFAAEYVGCSPRMFDNMVKDGTMPSPRLIGTKKIWDRYELDEYFEGLPRPEADNDNFNITETEIRTAYAPGCVARLVRRNFGKTMLPPPMRTRSKAIPGSKRRRKTTPSAPWSWNTIARRNTSNLLRARGRYVEGCWIASARHMVIKDTPSWKQAIWSESETTWRTDLKRQMD